MILCATIGYWRAHNFHSQATTKIGIYSFWTSRVLMPSISLCVLLKSMLTLHLGLVKDVCSLRRGTQRQKIKTFLLTETLWYFLYFYIQTPGNILLLLSKIRMRQGNVKLWFGFNSKQHEKINFSIERQKFNALFALSVWTHWKQRKSKICAWFTSLKASFGFKFKSRSTASSPDRNHRIH